MNPLISSILSDPNVSDAFKDRVKAGAAQPVAPSSEEPPIPNDFALCALCGTWRKKICGEGCTFGIEGDAVNGGFHISAEILGWYYKDWRRLLARNVELEGRVPPAPVLSPATINPRVIDNDRGEITVTLDGKELRGWSYSSEQERRTKMRAAREYVEGYCNGRDAR